MQLAARKSIRAVSSRAFRFPTNHSRAVQKARKAIRGRIMLPTRTMASMGSQAEIRLSTISRAGFQSKEYGRGGYGDQERRQSPSVQLFPYAILAKEESALSQGDLELPGGNGRGHTDPPVSVLTGLGPMKSVGVIPEASFDRGTSTDSARIFPMAPVAGHRLSRSFKTPLVQPGAEPGTKLITSAELSLDFHEEATADGYPQPLYAPS